MPIASASYTISRLNDGLTTFYQYAKNTSNTTAPTTGWSDLMPSSEIGKFIWRREARALSLGLIGSGDWGGAVCLTGATGSTGLPGSPGDPGSPGRGVTSIVTEYYHSTSATSQVEGTWSTTVPIWADGKFVWSRTKITYTDATTATTSPVCLSGGSGPAGVDGNDAGAIAPALFSSGSTLTITTGTVYLNKIPHVVPSLSLPITGSGKGLIVLDLQEGQSPAVHYLKMRAETVGQDTSIIWLHFNTGATVSISNNSYVIGKFEANGGEIGSGELIIPNLVGLYIQSQFMEILASVLDVDDTEFVKMAEALGVGQIFKSIVALEIVARNIRASGISVGNGNEQSGFMFQVSNGDEHNPPVVRALFDGKSVFEINPATGQVSIVGKVTISEGSVGGTSIIDTPMFKTQPGTTSGSISSTVAASLWSVEDLYTWLSAVTVGEAFQTASGTLDGVAINAVTKVENGRALVHANTSSAGVTGPDGDKVVYTYTVPEGVTHLVYSGSFPGDWTSFAIYKNGVKIFGSSSSSISGTLAVTTGDVMVFRGANSAWAVFGSKTCTWTTKWYTPVGTGVYFRLTGDVTKLLLKGYYGTSRDVSLTFGGVTWPSAGANTKYRSGATFLSLHNSLSRDFQYNCSGTVTINGVSYTVSKITVSSDVITYQLTNGTFQYVYNYRGDGTTQGVYADLVSAVSITGQVEAILTSSILPNGVGKDIGSAAIKFLNLYLSGAVSANTGTFSGALACAFINTGDGDFKIGQNLRATDSPTFANITLTGSEGSRTPGSYPVLRVPGGNAPPSPTIVWTPTTVWGEMSVTPLSGRSNVWTKMWEYKMKKSGTLTAVMTLRVSGYYSNRAWARIYKNDVAVGVERKTTSLTAETYTENISFEAGDRIQLYSKSFYASSSSDRTTSIISLEFRSAEQGGLPFSYA